MNKLTETSIPQNFSSAIFNDLNYDLSPVFVPSLADIIFISIAQALGDRKRKDQPTSILIKKANTNFIAGATIVYMPNEDDASKPGSWNYSWTWNKEDIPANSNVIDIKDPDIYSYFKTTAYNKYTAAFDNQIAVVDMTRYLLETISKWLEDNASEAEEVGVEMEGVFEASVAVEDGQVVKSLVPKGEIKELIKDDSKIEV